MSFTDTYEDLRGRFNQVFTKDEDYDGKPPKKGDEKVAAYVNALWKDSVDYFRNAFSKNKEGKDARFGFSDPESWWEALDRLEGGDHWEVFGSRKEGNNNSWKQEFVDNEIQDQIRARNSFITANWHDITITPNLNGINDILDQERKLTDWGSNVQEWVKFAQRYGFVWVRTILDKTENPNGTVREITCNPGSVLKTPNAKSKKKLDGCWYIAHGQEVNDDWVRKNYPDFDTSNTAGETPSFLKIDRRDKENTYTHTKMFNKLEVFLDDESLETIPFDEEEFNERIGLLMANIQAGEQNQVEPTPNDNHKKYIKAYLEWLEEKVDFYKRISDETHIQGGSLLQEDTDLINKVVSYVSEQVMLHEDLIEEAKEKNNGIPVGKRQKYPFGRYIVTLNGVLAEDSKNPYDDDWRILFHYLPNEKVPNREDGRSDIEILWKDNFILDTMLSRFADDALLSTNKKPWFHVNEKKQIDEAGISTDPTVPGYYVSQPPTFQTGQANSQYIESYQISKSNIKQKLGINDVTYGQRGSSSESGKHAELLLSQNATIVTGELNQNLNNVIEDIVETRIALWKKFYIEPRIFLIEGEMVELVLSEYLSQQEVTENGQVTYKEIPALQVSVRPESNFPNKVETETQMLLQLRSQMPEEIPAEMILDYMSRRFPSLGKNGKYRKENEFTKIGKQVVAQQEQQKQQEQIEASKPTAIDEVKKKVQSRITSQAAQQIMEGQMQ